MLQKCYHRITVDLLNALAELILQDILLFLRKFNRHFNMTCIFKQDFSEVFFLICSIDESILETCVTSLKILIYCIVFIKTV